MQEDERPVILQREDDRAVALGVVAEYDIPLALTVRHSPPFPSPLLQGMLRGMPYEACSAWGRLFWRVQGSSSSRSDSFLLLRVAARLRLGGRVGSYVVRQAWSPTIPASFLGSSGRAAMQNRDAHAWRQALPRANPRHHLRLYRGNCPVRCDSTMKEDGD